MTEYFLLCVFGRLIIFLLQKFPFEKIYFLGKFFKRGKFLEQLLSCPLCLGVWVYAILNLALFRVNMIDEYVYSNWISYTLTGVVTSFVVYVFTTGWSTLYQNVVIE